MTQKLRGTFEKSYNKYLGEIATFFKAQNLTVMQVNTNNCVMVMNNNCVMVMKLVLKIQYELVKFYFNIIIIIITKICFLKNDKFINYLQLHRPHNNL